MPKKQNYHHGNLRQQLLTKADEMISSGGLDSLTMREIGKQIGVSRTAPYNHFKDKSALLSAVATEYFLDLKNRLSAIDATDYEDAMDYFKAMSNTYLEFALENPERYQLMFGKNSLRRSDYPELKIAADEAFYQLILIIEFLQRYNILKEGNSRSYAYIAWASFHGLSSLIIDKQIEHQVDSKILTDFTIQTLIEGMKKD
ncbi:MAG: TetR/AcrR family transcriptional regulator [Calditrichaeota bacterium]|nr:MAG: TetR/AcrR family transcriptional regulator [Calditrichota bacterium]